MAVILNFSLQDSSKVLIYNTCLAQINAVSHENSFRFEFLFKNHAVFEPLQNSDQDVRILQKEF